MTLIRLESPTTYRNFIIPLSDSLRINTSADEEFLRLTAYGKADVIQAFLDDILCGYEGSCETLSSIEEGCVDEVGLDHSNPADRKHIDDIHNHLQDCINRVFETTEAFKDALLKYGRPNSVRDVVQLDHNSILVTLEYGGDVTILEKDDVQESFQKEKGEATTPPVSEG